MKARRPIALLLALTLLALTGCGASGSRDLTQDVTPRKLNFSREAPKDAGEAAARLGLGILNYTKKYSKLALEDCCRLAIDTNHISYSFIKNSIAAVAEEIGTAGFNTKLNEERNKGAFIMSPHAGDLERLLSKSSKLAKEVRDEEA